MLSKGGTNWIIYTAQLMTINKNWLEQHKLQINTFGFFAEIFYTKIL